MKSLIIAMLALIVSMKASSATGSSIVATKIEKLKTVIIALDSKGTPRVDGNLNTYPTIKDFRDGHNYSTFCYTGTLKSAKKLLTALVDSANGDGDSWADLSSVKTNSRKQIEVIASISDESGENEESFIFHPCKI